MLVLLKYTIILSLQKTLVCSNGTEHARPKVTAVLESPQITEFRKHWYQATF
jgi:hypothetical protein